jgi:hypothetical protein
LFIKGSAESASRVALSSLERAPPAERRRWPRPPTLPRSPLTSPPPRLHRSRSGFTNAAGPPRDRAAASFEDRPACPPPQPVPAASG